MKLKHVLVLVALAVLALGAGVGWSVLQERRRNAELVDRMLREDGDQRARLRRLGVELPEVR